MQETDIVRRRRMNADRRRRFGAAVRQQLALLCECGDAECHRTVMLSPQEYDARVPGVVIHPDHELEAELQA